MYNKEELKKLYDNCLKKAKKKGIDKKICNYWKEELKKSENTAEIIGRRCSICNAQAFEEDEGWKTDKDCPHFPN